MKDLKITSPANPAASFELWRGWAADTELREHLGRMALSLVRWPHHTSSTVSLVGSLRDDAVYSEGLAMAVQPGELLLAGAGLLVLQDLPEFRREAIEMIAATWREGALLLRRQDVMVKIPVRCSIIATTQLCPCGMADRREVDCHCTSGAMARWNKRIGDAVVAFRGL